MKGKGCHVGQGHGLPTSAQWEQLVLQNITGICALVHQVQLSDDPDGALTWGAGCGRRGLSTPALALMQETPGTPDPTTLPLSPKSSSSFTHCLPVLRPPFILHGGPNDF